MTDQENEQIEPKATLHRPEGVKTFINAKPGQKMKVLVAGPPGAGKTTLMRSLPGTKLALIFDPNASESLVGAEIDYIEFLPDEVPVQAMPIAKGNQPIQSKPWRPKAYKNFENWYYKNMNSDFIGFYDWIIIDSYTSLVNIMMDEIMALNKRPNRRPMIDDYGAVVQSIENLFRDLIPKVNNVFITAHTFLDKDEVTGSLTNVLQMTKGQMKSIPILMTDIWGIEMQEEGKPVLLTQQDRRHPWIRSSLGKSVDAKEPVFISDFSNAEKEGVGRILRKAGRI